MDPEYDWNWSNDQKGIAEPLPGDQLGRAKYAQFLTGYLAGFTNEPYVMNLNAEWGAGKSWFLQRWYHTVKAQHPAAYIDAWKNDFSDDPLLTVASGLLEALESSEAPNAAAEKYRASSLRKLGQFIKGASKSALTHQANKHLGEDATEILKAGMSEVSETVVRSVIEEHRNKMNVISELKTEIENWITLITTDSELSKPMFVFIDELDRCRPTYAIELLETVKHLFDVKGLVFVIATNTDQLQHSIKAVYGSEFDAQRYLYRFFNRSFTLKKPDLLSFIQTQPVFKNHLAKALLNTCDGNVIVENEEILANNLAAIAESFGFDLRTTLQWMDQIKAIYSDENNRNKYFWLTTAILLGVKISSPSLFSSFITKHEERSFEGRADIKEFASSLLSKYPTDKNIQLSINLRRLNGVRINLNRVSQYNVAFRGENADKSYSGNDFSEIIKEVYDGLLGNKEEESYRVRLAQAAYDV